jgi:hypothetical protein
MRTLNQRAALGLGKVTCASLLLFALSYAFVRIVFQIPLP